MNALIERVHLKIGWLEKFAMIRKKLQWKLRMVRKNLEPLQFLISTKFLDERSHCIDILYALFF